MRFYGLDLREEVRHSPARRLWALVRGLPREAAVWREDLPEWTRQDELAAIGIEVADAWGRSLYALVYGVATGKRAQLPKPIQIDHPDRRPAPEPTVTSDPTEIRRFFQLHLKGGESQ